MKAARRSPPRTPSGTRTVPARRSPAEGMVTASSVIGEASLIGGMREDLQSAALVGRTLARGLAESKLAPARVGLVDVIPVRPDRRREAGAAELRVRVVVEI